MFSVGRVRGSGCLLGRSLTDDVNSERGGDFSALRMGSSFFKMLSVWMSAGDWKWNLL